jgi:hypothetical protein
MSVAMSVAMPCHILWPFTPSSQMPFMFTALARPMSFTLVFAGRDGGGGGASDNHAHTHARPAAAGDHEHCALHTPPGER